MAGRAYRFSLLVISLSLMACGSDSGRGVGSTDTVQQVAEVTVAETPAAENPVEPAVGEAGEAGEAGEIDEQAVAVLRQMTSTLASLQVFSVSMETGFDVTQPDGEKLEFGSRRSASISRPDKAHFRFRKRSGEGGELVFDGSDIWAFVPEENAYASIPQPGDIDASIDFVTTELGIPVPVSDFFAADPSVSLAEGVLSARDLGPSTIGGRSGRYIAMRKAGVSYQIWVAEEDSLPTRVVITYFEEPGQPQFWAQFIEWELEPDTGVGVFQFQPPEGAERIRFATYDSSVELEEEAAQ